MNFLDLFVFDLLERTATILREKVIKADWRLWWSRVCCPFKIAHAAKKRVTVVFKVFIAQGKIWGTTTRFLISVFFLVKKMCSGMYFIFRLERTSSPPPFQLLHLPLISCPFLHSPLPTFPSPLLSFTVLPSPLLLSPLSLVLSPEPDACGTKESARLSRACAILPNISQFRCVVILRKSSDFFQHKRSPFSPFIT